MLHDALIETVFRTYIKMWSISTKVTREKTEQIPGWLIFLNWIKFVNFANLAAGYDQSWAKTSTVKSLSSQQIFSINILGQ